MSRPRFLALLLALITLVVYLPVRRFDFVNFDDNAYVTDNAFVKNGLTWTDIRWAFTTSYAGNWHPLTWLSHMTDYELFQMNAGGHHLVNVLLHSASVMLLFVLLVRLAGRIWPAMFIAALFAWHPLHVESVAWVSERKDVLSTFFAMLTLLSYAKFVQAGSRRSFWLALLFFGLGLMAKPMLVTLPFVMLLLDWWPLNRIPRSGPGFGGFQWLVFEKIPFFMLTLVSCVVTFIVQDKGQAVASLTRVPLHYRLENAPVATVKYVMKLLWPTDLCAFYPMQGDIPRLLVATSVGFLIMVTIAAWHWRRSKPYLLTGWLWFLGTLVPVIGLVQVGGQAMADRYSYIPSIGFCIALVFLAADLAVQIRLPKSAAVAALLLLSTACILATENQLQSWRDGEALYLRALAVKPVNDIALIEGGLTLADEGRNTEALRLYWEAERIAPERYQIHNNLGNLLGTLGYPEASLAEYRKGIALSPDNAFLHNAAGSELSVLGRFDEAFKEFAEAEKDDPTLAAPHFEAAKTLFKIGRDADGVKEFQTALRLGPENFQILATTAHYLAADENDAIRDGNAALPLAIKANILSGQNQPAVFDILGMALAENGDFTNAIACAQNALDIATTMKLKSAELIRVRLELYQKNRPWRESFRATNAPPAP